MRIPIDFLRAAMHCALRREWGTALMYLRTFKACLGKPPF